METNIKLGIYKHFRGGIYNVIGFATNTETMEDMVLYNPVPNPLQKTWARPITMWNDMVDGKIRFCYCENIFKE